MAFPPGPETAISLRNILVSAALPPAQSLEAIELLARAPDAAPEMIQNLEGWALRDLDRAVADGMAPLEALVNNAQVLGATGRLLLIEEFSRQDSLIARLEILNSLLNLPIEFQEPFITDFVRREALPWAREHLGVLVDASLAYIGRSDQRPNLAFTSLIGLFGMHGSEEDIPRIEALRISMQNRCASWPKAIRESVLQAGEECCLRTLDLLALSQ